MKIRQGFVSNSSSSSFILYGTRGTLKNINNFIKNVNIENETNKYRERMPDGPFVLIDDIERFFYKEGLEIRQYYWEENDCEYCIGANPTDIPDNMTMGEWKNSIKEKLERLCGIKRDLEFILDEESDNY